MLDMTSAPVLLFRADGGPGIGAGHVMRCLALAQELRRQGASCHLATCRPEAATAWTDDGFPVLPLPGAIAGAAELAATAALAARPGTRWLICDSYALSAAEHAVLRRAGCRMACWDDLADRPLSCDLVINHNAGAALLDYPCPALLGPHYATLRREILGLHRHPGGGILITFGAAEPAELGLAAARALLTACPDAAVHLVCPPVQAAEEALPSLIPMSLKAHPCPRRARSALGRGLNGRLPAHRFEPMSNIPLAGMTLHPVGPALAPLMAAADVVLCAGGVTLLELAFLGAPMVVLPLADNQQPGSRAMAAAGAAVIAEDLTDAAQAVARLRADDRAREAMAAAGRTLVDGHGAERVARRLLEEGS